MPQQLTPSPSTKSRVFALAAWACIVTGGWNALVGAACATCVFADGLYSSPSTGVTQPAPAALVVATLVRMTVILSLGVVLVIAGARILRRSTPTWRIAPALSLVLLLTLPAIPAPWGSLAVPARTPTGPQFHGPYGIFDVLFPAISALMWTMTWIAPPATLVALVAHALAGRGEQTP